jgi:phosphocarrier protein HPr
VRRTPRAPAALFASRAGQLETRFRTPLTPAAARPTIHTMAHAEQTVVLANRMGLHARPSTQIATAASRFAADVTITKDDMTVDAKSVLELLMLAAECGSELTVQADGDDAKAAVTAIAHLVTSRFGELDVDA